MKQKDATVRTVAKILYSTDLNDECRGD